MASIQSLGIGSGLLTSELLDNLILAERAPVENRLNANQELADAKISAFGELRSALSIFESELQSLVLPSTFNANQTVSSNEQMLTATASTLAVTGSYTVSVAQLAQTHSLASGTYDSVNQAVGTGVLTFRLGTTSFTEQGEYESFALNPTAQSKSVIISSNNNTLGGIRDAVNAANFGVQASIVDDGNGYRLLFSSKTSGEKQSIEITASGTTGLQAFNYNLASETASAVAQTQVGATDLSTGAGLDSANKSFQLNYNGIVMDVVVVANPLINSTEDALVAVQAALDQALLDNGFSAGAVIADGTDDVLSFRTAAEGYDQSLRILQDGSPATVTGSTVLSDGFDFASNNATFSIAIDGGLAEEIVINTASASRLETIDLINQALLDEGINLDITASLNDSNELVFTRTSNGSAARITISAVDASDTAGSLELGLVDADEIGLDGFGLNTAEGTVTGSVSLQQTMAAQNANFSVNGISVTRGENLAVGVIPGTTLNLKGVTTGPVTLSIDKNTANTITKVENFVIAYNDLKGLADALTAFNPDSGESGQGSLLTGDTTLRLISAEISKMLRTSVPGLTGGVRSLSDVGITTNQNNDYKLQFDANKFSQKFISNPSEVIALFANAGTTTDTQVSYISTGLQTQPGTYSVEIARLATVGSYQGAVVASLAAGDIVIDDDNNQFSLELNGVDASVTLTNGIYATAADLAEQIQLQINSDSSLAQSNNSVEVIYNSDAARFEINSNRFGSESSIVFTTLDSNIADTLGLLRAGQGDFRGNQLAGLATATGDSAENFTTPVQIDSTTSFSLSINGESTALITLPGNSATPVTYNTPNDLIAAIKAQIDADPLFVDTNIPEIFVSYSYNADSQLGRLIFSTGSHADTLSVADTTAGTASQLGLFIGNGALNRTTTGVDVAGKINGVEALGNGQSLVAATGNVPASPGFYLNQAHGNLATSTGADSFRVSVDGAVSGDISLGTISNTNPLVVATAMQSAINNNPAMLAAGVSVSVQFDSNSGGFGIISNSTGATSSVQIVSMQGNAASIFGFAAGAGSSGATGSNASGDVDASSGLRLEITGGALGNRGSVSFVQGIADRLDKLLESYLGSNGLLSSRTNALNVELATIAEKRLALDARIARSEERLRTSFLANDLIISRFNTTAEFLTAQLEMLENLASSTVSKKK